MSLLLQGPSILLADNNADMRDYIRRLLVGQYNRQVRRIPGQEQVVLAALTGWGQQEDRHRSKEAGLDDHLVKPLQPAAPEKLLAEVQSATV